MREILADVKDIHFATLTSNDVVRHKLVGRIVAAYDAFENGSSQTGPSPAAGQVDHERRRPR